MSMVLNNRRLICGINPKIAKKICEMCHRRALSAQDIASELSITVLTAENWLSDLAKADYLEVEVENDRILWICAPKGYTALATARFGNPLSGVEFTELLSTIAHRAKAYNESVKYPLYIDKIFIFGAILYQPWLIEDPDITIVTSERPAFSKKSGWRLNYCSKRAPEKHISVTEQIYFAENELRHFLKKPTEHFSIYCQDISELSDEKKLLFCGDHIEPSDTDGALMTKSEIRDLGEKIEQHRETSFIRKRRGRARIHNEEIVNYWKNSAWFRDLHIATDQASSCCWRCGGKQDVQQCHIIPDALGGGFEESNLVLLCARCHAEGPNLQDARIMFDWIKSYKARYKSDFWIDVAMDEYKRIYDKDVQDEVKETLRREKISMEVDKAMLELRLLANEASSTAIFHFGQSWLNNASMAGCFRLALERLPEHLRGL